MEKNLRTVKKSDLLAPDIYAKNRKRIRKELVEYKKDRRILVGPYATFYFECFKTMLGQIQEMLYIEKGGDEQLQDELKAYNPLIPKGKELVATLMFEIENPAFRTAFLNKVGGIENRVYLIIGSEKIISSPEQDLDRTSAEGKASSVQFVHFYFSENQISKFKDTNIDVIIGIDHNEYSHYTKLQESTRTALSKDFY